MNFSIVVAANMNHSVYINKTIRCFIISLMLLFCMDNFAVAQQPNSFATKSESIKKQLKKISSSLIYSKSISEEKQKDFRKKLREIRKETDAEIVEAKELLKNKEELISSLGEAPEDPTKEDIKIQNERKKLAEELEDIDTRVKSASLIAAKIDELLIAVDNYKKAQLKKKLLARSDNLLSLKNLNAAMRDAKKCLQNFSAWYELALFSSILLVLCLLSIPIKRGLNRFFSNSDTVKLVKPFRYGHIISTIAAAYFLFLFRFDFIDISKCAVLKDNVYAILSASLAIFLFLDIGRIAFMSADNAKDELGEISGNYSWLWNGIRGIFRFALLSVPLLTPFGYINFGFYIAFNIFATISSVFLFVLFRNLFLLINRKISKPDEKDKKRAISPIVITILEPLLAFISVAFALFFWGMTTDELEGWLEKYRTGIPIGDITINFSSIISAVAMFFILYLITKTLQWFLSHRVFPYTKLDMGIRHAIIAVLGYVGVIIAALASASALGFDLSNLAIVAGALSVGIGFGLQAIFNNFVSGLILLFERPLKVGDYVAVGENAGIIKKIRVRSTEIRTFSNSSVILPNSQLISETVTNWTLHDRAARLDISVGVAYGSDVEKVKEVLLEVAKEHPQIRAIPHPKVYFLNFGDSSLDFEIRCFVRNVNERHEVSSDLRFAINRVFIENGIQIPFPQRDLHIINPEALVKEKEE